MNCWNQKFVEYVNCYLKIYRKRAILPKNDPWGLIFWNSLEYLKKMNECLFQANYF